MTDEADRKELAWEASGGGGTVVRS